MWQQLWLPIPYAMAAAAVGGLLADLIAGFAAYAPFTAVVKLLIALVVGLIARNNAFVGRLRGHSTQTGGFVPLIAASIAGGAVNVGGYFCNRLYLVWSGRGSLLVSHELSAIRIRYRGVFPVPSYPDKSFCKI